MLGWLLIIIVVAVLVLVVVMALRNQRRDPMPTKSISTTVEDDEGAQVRVVSHRLVQIVGGVKVGDEILIVNTISIGRGKDCTVCLQDPELSQVHAEVSLDKDRAYVLDVGSANGTMLNDHKLEIREACPLSDGDRIKVGTTIFVYKGKP